jgi:exportin-5
MSPLCAQAGFYLVHSTQFSAIVKHFGLQLMEHQVKFNWIKISQEEKIFIKDNTMKLLATGVGPADDISLLHIKDALSRIVVEMIKREWPQQWPTLLAELSAACEKGLSQTELVALIFLRLVEDVALLQTIESNQRRKDIYQALTVNMTEIFEFFLNQIEKNVREFSATKSGGNLRVVSVVLNTLAGFVEWVNIAHIMGSEGRLLKVLCYLLEFPQFQLASIECLSQITNRKGVLKDRKPLLYFFNDEPMGCIYRSLASMASTPTENYHQYLKKLSQAMLGLASIITALCGKESDLPAAPKNFVTFLEVTLMLIQHPSISVNQGGICIWLQLVKHDAIAKDQLFINSIPALIEIVGPKVLKRPFPRVRHGLSTTAIPYTTEGYACIEFDGEEEYMIFVYRLRVDLLEVFRQATLLAPLVTFSYCERWLCQRIELSHSENLTTCSITDPVYLEWEAIVAVLDGVLSRILLITERPSINNGLKLLEKCLHVKTEDPLIYSVLLSCISSLFVFLSMSASGSNALNGGQLLVHVLQKIFDAIVFNLPSEDPNSMRAAAVKNLKRHAASWVVKIALKYPLLLLSTFDQINSHIKTLCSTESSLSSMEKLLLQEALLIISNHFCEFEKQQIFVGEVMRPAFQLWQNVSPHLKSAATLIDYIGLSAKPPLTVISGNDDIFFKNRQALLLALNTVLGVVKRCQCPDDPDKSYRGGFIVATTDAGNPIQRNPAAPHVIPLLQPILALLKCLNEMYTPASILMIYESYRGANQMLEHEKKVTLGVVYALPDPLDPTQLVKIKTPFDYMQQFLSTIFENSYHFMGVAGSALGRDFYGLENLAAALAGSCLAGLEHVPDYRLRSIIRVFLRPFVYSCPATYHISVIVPIFGHLAPHSKFT